MVNFLIGGLAAAVIMAMLFAGVKFLDWLDLKSTRYPWAGVALIFGFAFIWLTFYIAIVVLK